MHMHNILFELLAPLGDGVKHNRQYWWASGGRRSLVLQAARQIGRLGVQLQEVDRAVVKGVVCPARSGPPRCELLQMVAWEATAYAVCMPGEKLVACGAPDAQRVGLHDALVETWQLRHVLAYPLLVDHAALTACIAGHTDCLKLTACATEHMQSKRVWH